MVPHLTTTSGANPIFTPLGLPPWCSRFTKGQKVNPIYKQENTKAAYQLNWAVSLFAKGKLPDAKHWLPSVKDQLEFDGYRILSTRVEETLLQFFLSAQPQSSPEQIVRLVKGRSQYAIREIVPKAFRRNYSIKSLGAVKASVLDNYVAHQPAKHPMVDPTVQEDILAVQFHDPQVRLATERLSSHGQFVNSLHLVFENDRFWNETNSIKLKLVRDMIIAAAKKKQWLLSRIGLVANHVHILLGASVTESPATVATSLMNNIAYCYEMKPILRYSYYAGTFGEFDRNAILNCNDGLDKR